VFAWKLGAVHAKKSFLVLIKFNLSKRRAGQIDAPSAIGVAEKEAT
jgi:hypothetical protein